MLKRSILVAVAALAVGGVIMPQAARTRIARALAMVRGEHD
jgi:hypothetical protein